MNELNAPTLSIVVPAMNEADNLRPLYRALGRVLDSANPPVDFELILVDDGSTDQTGAIIDALAREDHRVRGIFLARNFGQQAALLAGVEAATGQAVVTMDADLEQPPQTIIKMLAAWRNGAQVVHGVRIDHPDTGWFKRWSSRLFYKVFRFLSRIPIEPGMLDFRLMDQQVVEAIKALPETDFFLRGITTWIGFNQTRIPYQSGIRARGKTKYSITRMISFALRGITSFSTFPLRLGTYAGVFMMIGCLGYGAFVGIRHFFWDHPTPGYTSTILLISVLASIQFLLIGTLGEYVARIHVEVKKRPRYFVARTTAHHRQETDQPKSSQLSNAGP